MGNTMKNTSLQVIKNACHKLKNGILRAFPYYKLYWGQNGALNLA